MSDEQRHYKKEACSCADIPKPERTLSRVKMIHFSAMEQIGIDTFTSQSLFVFGTVTLVWFVASTVTSWYRLRHIPGPWLASISNLWMIRASTSTRLSEVFEEAGESYGSLVRIGPNQILTSDADFLRKSAAVRGTYNRSPWYIAFRCMDVSCRQLPLA